MVLSVIKKVVLFIPNKVGKINLATQKFLGLSDKAEKTYLLTTKTVGATSGTIQARKGSVDLVEAIVCQDGICAVISGIGLTADLVQVAASFVPGPNVTVVVTLPISCFCKTFVWACKRSTLPFGGC